MGMHGATWQQKKCQSTFVLRWVCRFALMTSILQSAFCHVVGKNFGAIRIGFMFKRMSSRVSRMFQFGHEQVGQQTHHHCEQTCTWSRGNSCARVIHPTHTCLILLRAVFAQNYYSPGVCKAEMVHMHRQSKQLDSVQICLCNLVLSACKHAVFVPCKIPALGFQFTFLIRIKHETFSVATMMENML